MLDRKLKVLFICRDNSILSRIAEGYLRSMAGGKVEAASAGFTAGEIFPATAEVMREEGIELHNQPPKTIFELTGPPFDLIITIKETAAAAPGDAQVGKLLRPERETPAGADVLNVGLPNLLNWNVPDPLQGPDPAASMLPALRRTRGKIKELVETLVNQGYIDAFTKGKARLEGILDLLDEGILVHDDLQHIYLFNKAAEKITGYERKEVLGRHCHSIFPPNGLCGTQCAFAGDGYAEDIKLEREVLMVTRDGEERRLMMKTALLRDDRPVPAGRVLAAFQDITELKSLRTSSRTKQNLHGIITASQDMSEILNTIRRVSTSDYPVLITGESGTGKELVAQAVHNESLRRGAPFVPINCGALPEGILESELFGHVRGAFTGAIRDKKGRFELADGGTLFLDEIGELSPTFQVKLLRVLQEKKIERIGGEKTISVDVRIVTATNRDLRKMVQDGEFREDLFYRICVVPISLPPLRERKKDIPLLVQHFLAQIMNETGRKTLTISSGASQQLLYHHWPGNVRELLNVLQFASLQCPDEEIKIEHLPPDLFSGMGSPAGERRRETPLPAMSREESTAGSRNLTREAVLEALNRTGGNKVKAARLLGIGRATLYRFLKRNPL